MLFINFKTYPKGIGGEGVELAKKLTELGVDVPVIPVVQVADIWRVREALRLSFDAAQGGRSGQISGTGGKVPEIWAQHVDGIEPGQNTGYILPEAVKEAGATGTFLNHSEHPTSLRKPELGGTSQDIEVMVKRCREVGLKTMVFAGGTGELLAALRLKPDWVAYEPPELVGSKTDSVASRPEVVVEAVKASQEAGIPLMIGAGVKSVQDVRFSLVSGARAVGVARAIMEAVDPVGEVSKLLEGFSLPGIELAGGV